MEIKCIKCGAISRVSNYRPEYRYRCPNCGSWLPRSNEPTGETSAAVGLIGGAALGAAIGGPPGALIGAVVGAILGSTAKGVG